VSEQPVLNFDVIICGGGPAGSTCALAFVDSGLKIAVIEKFSFPRDKVCGDAVAAYVPKVLGTLHPKFKDALAGFDEKVFVNTCRIVAPNTKAFDITVPEGGFIATRVNWDNYLFELASQEKNVTFFLNQTIADVAIDKVKSEVSVQTDKILFKGKIVIGCDGAHSIVSKKAAKTKMDLNHYSGAVRAYYKNVTDIPDRAFEIHCLKGILPGYFWIFPVKNNMANVGLGIPSADISRKKLNLRRLFHHSIQNTEYLKERFKNAEQVGDLEGFGLPLGSRKIKMSGDNFILCGDAASLIDPLSGEGIGQAMISGRYAAWQTKKCFEHYNFTSSFMLQYDKQVYDKLWARHRKSYLMKQIIGNREWLVNGLITMASKKGIARDFLTKVLE
jgi:menaquinone-9 beta-reductase